MYLEQTRHTQKDARFLAAAGKERVSVGGTAIPPHQQADPSRVRTDALPAKHVELTLDAGKDVTLNMLATLLHYRQNLTFATADQVSCRKPSSESTLYSPLEFVMRLDWTMLTPSTTRTRGRWLGALQALSAYTVRQPQRLRYLRTGFVHDCRRRECSLGVLRNDQLYQKHFPSEEPTARRGKHGGHPMPMCCAELARDHALAEAVASFRGLDRLVVCGFYASLTAWPAVLDKYVDPSLSVWHVGFMHTIPDDEGHFTSAKVLKVDYRTTKRAAVLPVVEDVNKQNDGKDSGSSAEDGLTRIGPVMAYVNEIGCYV